MRCGWSPTLMLATSRALLKEITDTRSSPATDTKQYFPFSLDCDQYGYAADRDRALEPERLRVTIAA